MCAAGLEECRKTLWCGVRSKRSERARSTVLEACQALIIGEKEPSPGTSPAFRPLKTCDFCFTTSISYFCIFFSENISLFYIIPPGLLHSPRLRIPSVYDRRCLVPLRSMASDQEAANALKLKGNKAFAEHEWPTAVDFYTQAIEKYAKEPSFFCNRAQVRRLSDPRHNCAAPQL